MRRIVALVVCGLLVAPLVFAQDVLSQNAVGYVKLTCDVGALVLTSYDFEDIDDNDLYIGDIVGDQLDTGSAAYLWDKVNGEWLTETKSRSGWSATKTIARGEGFFLQAAGTGPSYDVFLLGEVPGSNNDADSTTVLDVEAAAVGYAYPASTYFTNTTLAINAATGDSVAFWDGADWITDSKARSGWGATANAKVLAPGEGFFINLSVSGMTDWTEDKPYLWP